MATKRKPTKPVKAWAVYENNELVDTYFTWSREAVRSVVRHYNRDPIPFRRRIARVEIREVGR